MAWVLLLLATRYTDHRCNPHQATEPEGYGHTEDLVWHKRQYHPVSSCPERQSNNHEEDL